MCQEEEIKDDKQDYKYLVAFSEHCDESISNIIKQCRNVLERIEFTQSERDFFNGDMFMSIMEMLYYINMIIKDTNEVDVKNRPVQVYYQLMYYKEPISRLIDEFKFAKDGINDQLFDYYKNKQDAFNLLYSKALDYAKEGLSPVSMINYSDLHNCLIKHQEERKKINDIISAYIIEILKYCIHFISDALQDWNLKEDGQVMIERGAKLYSLENYKRDSNTICKQIRKLYQEPIPQLTEFHWRKMKDVEDMALELASRGVLSESKDDCYDIYDEHSRKWMDNNKYLIKWLLSNTSDDELIDIKSMMKNDGRLTDLLDFENYGLFYILILRRSIILGKIYPELENEFQAWMNGKMPKEKPKSELDTPQAMKLWEKLQKAGVVDENRMPIKLSDYKAAIVANRMRFFLTPTPSWKAFEELWNRKDLATKLVGSKDRNYYSDYYQYIDNILK